MTSAGNVIVASSRFIHSQRHKRSSAVLNAVNAIISACMLTFALSACSGSNYVMHTNDGRTIVSDGKPQTDNDTGMISYKDANGNKQQINRTDVKEMVELDQ